MCEGVTLFLRQNNRNLKQAALQTLESFVISQSVRAPANTVCLILIEVAAIFNNSNLNIAQLGLKLVRSVLRRNKVGDIEAAMKGSVLPATIQPLHCFKVSRLSSCSF